MDKREAVRVPVRVRAQCRAHDLVIDGTVEDISRCGVFFRAPSNLGSIAHGSSTEIKLDLPGEPPIHLPAEVVRVSDAGLGLRFLDKPEPIRRPLANFIMRCHASG